MVGLNGLDGLPQPAGPRQTGVREKRPEQAPHAGDHDAVTLSPEAREAAKATRLLTVERGRETVAEERIARAKEDIEAGIYRMQEVVEQVAATISRYIP